MNAYAACEASECLEYPMKMHKYLGLVCKGDVRTSGTVHAIRRLHVPTSSAYQRKMLRTVYQSQSNLEHISSALTRTVSKLDEMTFWKLLIPTVLKIDGRAHPLRTCTIFHADHNGAKLIEQK